MSVTREHLRYLHQRIPSQKRKGPGNKMLDYIDSRQVMSLLDAVLGPENWQDHYREVAGKIYCDLLVRVEGEWITKSDCGSESKIEGEKGQASDAFKRAAVKWGVGRFLYPKTQEQKSFKYKLPKSPETTPIKPALSQDQENERQARIEALGMLAGEKKLTSTLIARCKSQFKCAPADLSLSQLPDLEQLIGNWEGDAA
jgi:hypothetical protein